MGQRANILTIADGKRQLHYSHWCANTIFRDLFWGPEPAMAFAARQRRTGPDEWLDTVWAEGGAVIDRDAQSLLFFGGGDELFDIPLRRVLLALFESSWRPWTVRWAYRGIADLVDYAGQDRNAVLAPSDPPEPMTSLSIEEDPRATSTVGSIETASGETRLFPLLGMLDDYLRGGESLLRAAESEIGVQQLDLSEAGRDAPTGGFHIDVAARQVDYWRAGDDPYGGELIAAPWPGWRVEWHLDSYEFQVDRLRGRLVWPAVEPHVLLDRATQILMGDFEQQGPAGILELQREAEAKGESIEINPLALEAPPQMVALEHRRAAVAAAAAEFCRNHGC